MGPRTLAGLRGPEVRSKITSGALWLPGRWTPTGAGLGPVEPVSALLASRSGRKAWLQQRTRAAAMPFLHGFRRIIFEYQPLVDAILGALGIQDPERQEPLDG